jgi:hypothetical protein
MPTQKREMIMTQPMHPLLGAKVRFRQPHSEQCRGIHVPTPGSSSCHCHRCATGLQRQPGHSIRDLPDGATVAC